MNEHHQCLICGSDKIIPLLGYEASHLVRCKNCSFVFAKRIPDEKELNMNYNAYGRNDYLSPVTIKRYNELLDVFEKYRNTNRILDVGCGIGYFLCEAKKRGWEVYGTEFSPKAVEICKEKGIIMHGGVIDTLPSDWNNFDVVTSFEVIEHTQYPVKEVKGIHKVMRDGGLLYMTTPNFNSLLRYFLKHKYNVISYPDHLCYFSARTLRYLLSENGFKVSKVISSGLSISRAATSIHLKEESAVSESSLDQKLRTIAEKNHFVKIAKRSVNFILNTLKTGDALKVYAIKV